MLKQEALAQNHHIHTFIPVLQNSAFAFLHIRG